MDRLRALVVAAVFLCGTSVLTAAEEKKDGVRKVPIDQQTQKVDPPPRDPPRTAPPAKPDNTALPPSKIPKSDPPRVSTDTYHAPPTLPPDRGDRGCRGSPNCSERFDGGKK